jgi:hypothetical protein
MDGTAPSVASVVPGDAMRRSCAHLSRLCSHLPSMYGVWVQHTSLLCRVCLLFRINSSIVASGSYSVTGHVRLRSTAFGPTTADRPSSGRPTAFPFRSTQRYSEA